LFFLSLTSVCAKAQDETPTAITDQNRTGDLPFSTSIGSSIEHVDLTSGNLLVNIPIAHVPGRGMDFDFSLRYDSRILVVATRATQSWQVQRANYFPDATGNHPREFWVR